jgi:hypothetical protein
VIVVRWTGAADPQRPFSGGPRIAVAVVFTPESKRRLATLEATTQRALELGRQVVERTLPHPPDLSALACAVEVTGDELQPVTRPDLTTADGTRVWLVQVEA